MMKEAWRVVFEFIYVKQTCAPDYRPDDQPTIWHPEVIFLTDRRNVFDLRNAVEKYIKEYTQGTSLGSQRVDLQKIEYIGVVRE